VGERFAQSRRNERPIQHHAHEGYEPVTPALLLGTMDACQR
jgi:hypothetical protein